MKTKPNPDAQTAPPHDSKKPDREVLAEADALDLDKQRPTGPDDGFGKRWRKVHRIRLTGAGITPEQLIATWKEYFGDFWPGDNRFYGPITAPAPGELAVISLEMPGEVTLSTGVILAESSATSFSLITPRSHMLAGMDIFTAYIEGAVPVAQVEIVMRASDPLSEIGLVMFGHRRENNFWEQTLRNLANHFGVQAEPETRVTCEDRHYQWGQAKNIWHNGMIRNGLVRMAAIPEHIARRFRKRATDTPA